jgi:indole-3-glycerol phosphate synthase
MPDGNNLTNTASQTPTILRTIVERKWQEIDKLVKAHSVDEWRELAQEGDAPRGFVRSIRQAITDGRSAVIAEIKKASPSKGVIRENFNPSEIAKSYEQGGASCLSVLTDHDFFGGSNQYLQEARLACRLPIIRKDFIVDPLQVYEARSIGADCILLIAACLNDRPMAELNELASSLGMDVLIEVHNAEELARVLPLGNTLIGINNRDLHSFDVSLNNTYELLDKIGSDHIVVTESGISTPADVAAMRAKDVNAFLVGEAFMRADEPGEKLAELFA